MDSWTNGKSNLTMLIIKRKKSQKYANIFRSIRSANFHGLSKRPIMVLTILRVFCFQICVEK